MQAIPSLATPRLRLRPFRRDDLDDYAALCADPEVMRHLGAGGPVGRDVAWRHLAMFLGEWALNGRGQWAVTRREDNRLIGRVGYLQPEGWPGTELAWTLARAHWGQGLASEAVRAARQFGADALGIAAPISLIRPDNAASLRLAERVGAALETRLDDFLGGPALLYRHPAR